jgi:hypothetical protein
MTEQEVQEFVDVIAHSYPSFPRPSSMQLSLWSADLAPYGLPTAQEALRRWIRWHCGEYPQLGDVLHLIKVVEAESVRWRSTAEDVPSERTPDQSLMLRHLARLNQCMLAPWEDHTGQVHGRLTLRQAAALCRRWSARYRQRPELARDFALLAISYDALAADAAPRSAPCEAKGSLTPGTPANAGADVEARVH